MADKQIVHQDSSNGDPILVVDDDPHFLSIVTATLARAGREFVVATTGEQALTLLRRRRFSVVLLDIVLPDTSGLSILRNLAQLDNKAPVIITSGRARPVDGFAASQAGALAFLEKPFRMSELLDLISTVSTSVVGRRAGQPVFEQHTTSMPNAEISSTAERLARILVRASFEPRDFKTGPGLASVGAISYGTLRHWCSAVREPGRAVVRFARALWAVRYSSKRHLPLQDVLDVVDNSSKNLILGELCREHPSTPAEFYRSQRHLSPLSSVLEACLRIDPDISRQTVI